MLSKIRTLNQWRHVFADTSSLIRAYRMYRAWGAGQHHGTAADNAIPLRVRGYSFPLYCRPGTTDLMVLLELFQLGEYQHAKQLVREPVRTILDLGGNVGYSVAYFRSLWPDAEFSVVEPSADNLAMIRRNHADLLDPKRLTLTEGFIGGHRRRVAIDSSAGGSNELRLGAEDQASSDSVEVWTIPDVLAKTGWKQIDLLKCDIEGSEKELFENCKDWIGCVRNLVVELHTPLDQVWLSERLKANGSTLNCVKTFQNHSGAALAWYAGQ